MLQNYISTGFRECAWGRGIEPRYLGCLLKRAVPLLPFPMIQCTGCTEQVDPNLASYSDAGELVCTRCKASEEVALGDRRASDAILGIAGGGACLALVSICFNPFFVFSGIAIVSSVGAILTLIRHPEYHPYMGWKVSATWALACMGILAAMIRPALFLLLLLLG